MSNKFCLKLPEDIIAKIFGNASKVALMVTGKNAARLLRLEGGSNSNVDDDNSSKDGNTIWSKKNLSLFPSAIAD